MNDLDQLYQQVILDHSRERHGAGALDAPDGQSHQVNPTCGDEVTLDVKVQDGTIAAVGWQGEGCSISQASISVMHDLVDGADLETVARLEADFDALMHSRGKGVDEAVLDALEDGAAFEGVSKTPTASSARCWGGWPSRTPWRAPASSFRRWRPTAHRPAEASPHLPSPLTDEDRIGPDNLKETA